MHEFRSMLSRDAWATIRGYVYQVELTILRWLDLQPGEYLELERGEDIDLVLPGLTESETELQRRLEQVKHRESTMTLRAPEALAAVANFYSHRTQNTSVHLLFRFTTNAAAGREKPSPMPGKEPSLILWNRLHDGLIDLAQQPATIEGIRHLITDARPPEEIAAGQWNAAATFFASATDAQLLDFIRSFEWSLGAANAPELATQIKERLLSDGTVADASVAQAAYERLFLHVFKTLTQRGVKQLNQEALTFQLVQRTLSDDDARLITSLKDMIDRRFAVVEGRLAQHGEMLERISGDLEQLVRPDGSLGVLRYVAEAPILDVPPLPEPRSEREATVETLAGTAAQHPWVALHGAVGTGKTQLGALYAHYLMHHLQRDAEQGTIQTLWLMLRGLDPEAGKQIDAACAAATGIPPIPVRAMWYRQVCTTLGAGTLIVLDDLPRFTMSDGLGTRLMLLAQACAETQVHLFTTSVYPLSTGARTATSQAILYETEVPPFTDAEAAALLRAYGAPDYLLGERSISFLNTTAARHPILLTAMARFLAARDWRVSDETLEDVIRHTFASEVNDETMQQLLATIEEGDSRELLYRLTLIRHPFTLEDVQALAAVPQAVPRPREHLHALSGLWIQRDAGERFSVSPLVMAFGSSELGQVTAQVCHRVLGERIVALRTMTPLQIVDAIGHFVEGLEFDRAGALFAWALSELNRQPVEISDYGLLAMWTDLPLPSAMGLGIRLYIRAHQVAGRQRRAIPAEGILRDLDRLVDEASENEAWAMVGVVVATSGLIDAEHGLHYVRRAIALARTGRGPDEKRLNLPDSLPYEQVIWTLVPMLKTADHVREWLSILEAMTPEQRARALGDEDYVEQGAYALVEAIWLRETDKPAEQRNWEQVLQVLDDVARRAQLLGIEVLWACAIRTQVMVRAEYDQDLEGATRLAEAALTQTAQAPQTAVDPRVQLLVRESVGRQYLYADQPENAVRWLQDALTHETPAFPRVRMLALLALSRALIGTSNPAAVQAAQHAVEVARSADTIGELDVVRALGELALVQWQTDGVASAFDAWDDAGEQLFANRSERADWQDLCVLYRHVSGYLSSMASRGQPPAATADGEPYTVPQLGMLLDIRTDRAMLYDADNDAYLNAQLATFAEAVGRDDCAATWATRGVERARASKQWAALALLSLSALPHLVLGHRYGDVVETALEAGSLNVALRILRDSGESVVEQRGDYDDLLTRALGPKAGPQWQQAEELAAFLGIVPLAFRLATLAIADAAGAKSAAEEVAALCREIASSATDAQLWATVADCLERTFVTEAPAAELLGMAAQYEPDGASAVRVISRLGASLRARGSPRLALQIHQGLIPYMRQMLTLEPGMYRQVVTPFVVAFWQARFRDRRIHFRQPSVIEAELYDAVSRITGDIAQQVINAIAPGLP